MEIIHTIREIVWGPWLLALFLATGVWMSVKSGFFQIRNLPLWWKSTIGSLHTGRQKKGILTERENGGVSQFQTACTALAATVGTGNIVGVAAALSAGGPGAVFWMWVSAALGMMTAYSETYIGVRNRVVDGRGQWLCGAMVTLEKFHMPGLAWVYCFLVLMCSFGMGSMVQAGSFSEAFRHSLHIPPEVSGIFLVSLTAAVTTGGIKRIAKVSEFLVPAAAGIYIIMSGAVLFCCRHQIIPVFADIFKEAWGIPAAAGGAAGYGISRGIQYGMARGVFSNEAGLGTIAMFHGAAENTSPEEQGMWAVFEVFFDTIVVCTLTALVILCAVKEGKISLTGLGASEMAAESFAAYCGAGGEALVSGFLLIFSFATIIAWHYLGRQAAYYLASQLFRKNRLQAGRRAEGIYWSLYLAAVFLGCVIQMEVIWEFSDIWNGLMALPNMAALFLASGELRYPKKS